MFKIEIIAAIGRNKQLGLNGKLPWYLPSDMKRFKDLTLGKSIVMGRKTYESIGKPLIGRTNIVMSKDKNWKGHKDLYVFDNVVDIVDFVKKRGENTLMVIGGSSVYELFMEMATKMYITIVNYDGEADTFFPKDGGLWHKLKEKYIKKDKSTFKIFERYV